MVILNPLTGQLITIALPEPRPLADRSRAATTVSPLNRAMTALDARNGMSADHDVVRRIREGIASRQDQPGGWQALLDEATEGAGCSVSWDGDTVESVTVWDEPPRLSHRARDHHTVPFGHLDAQKAGEEDD